MQILRSGVTGRKSLGSAPKRLVENWLNTASEQKLLDASVGADPSLRDIVRMVHPKPADAMREALVWLGIGQGVCRGGSAEGTAGVVGVSVGSSRLKCRHVPFQMLTALELSREEWAEVAMQGSWQMVRMNLNTFARHGVFEIAGMADRVAEKLRDPGSDRQGTGVPVPVDGSLLRRRRQGAGCREGGFAGCDGDCASRRLVAAAGSGGGVSGRVGIHGIGGHRDRDRVRRARFAASMSRRW